MPFGLKNGRATFQRLIDNIISDFECRDACMDDLFFASETWKDYIRNIRELFERLSKAMVTFNLPKSDFRCATVT